MGVADAVVVGCGHCRVGRVAIQYFSWMGDSAIGPTNNLPIYIN